MRIEALGRRAVQALTALVLAAGTGVAAAQSVSGTATYRERIALPPGAVFQATLEDISKAGAPAEIVARTGEMTATAPPIAFTIKYDPSVIVARNRYVVRATIRLGEQLLFASDTAAPVITLGNPFKVDILLRRITDKAGGAQGPQALAGTAWKLVRFQGGNGAILKPDDGAKYTIEFAAGGVVTVRIDCNRGRGTWTSSADGRLQLGPLALTRAQCPEGSLHDHIVKQWDFIRSYLIKDGHLFLSLMADGGIYEFEPMAGAPK